MGCETISLPGGGFAIACSRGQRKPLPKCVACGSPNALFQCDYPDPTRRTKVKTCDAYLCAQHVKPQGDGVDYCPQHDAKAHFEALRAEQPA